MTAWPQLGRPSLGNHRHLGGTVAGVEEDAIPYFNYLHKKGNRIVEVFNLKGQLAYALRKTAGLVIRIALILQMVKHETGESTTTDLELSTLQTADKLCNYFIAHFYKFWIGHKRK